MNRILEEIKNAIIEPMKKMDIIVDSVTYETEGNYTFLKIELDRVKSELTSEMSVDDNEYRR